MYAYSCLSKSDDMVMIGNDMSEYEYTNKRLSKTQQSVMPPLPDFAAGLVSSVFSFCQI